MAQESSGRGPSPLNLNSLLALLTLVGSVWFVSNKLTSDRPVTPAGGARPFVGEQTLEARLWEDPFKGEGETDRRGETNLHGLLAQIQDRSKSYPVLLLPVMLSGGQYSEDQESRIRSRFAIVSALGRSGYAPEDAEHLGTLTLPWPTQPELSAAREGTDCFTDLWTRRDASCTNAYPLGTNTLGRMEMRYEWYRPRTFYPRSDQENLTNVLVLWLDDSFFEDDPLLRLPLLLEPLLGKEPRRRAALIGPRRSSTLRAMLPGPLAGTESLGEKNAALWELATNVLRRIDVFCATPSVMDEVLVEQASDPPRKAVRDAFKENGFNSFRNYAATDDQLAKEIFAELELRQFTNSNVGSAHLVLISEWDTFYARMLMLTYAAEMAVAQGACDRFHFVRMYMAGSNLPPNFHSFVYLRGLDGQTVGGSSGGKGKEPSAKRPGASLEELRNWVPDANKAEGQAQFDYLGRLGDQLADLEDRLRHEQGRVKIAVGIVGSDAYDTLLILQALRPRFSNFLFFTTDLDARFWHPREREWACNLIVASGYGLALNSNLQKDVSPFRDSAQTAQFAAALAALGDTNLVRLEKVPVQRFEIGNNCAVNLSVASEDQDTSEWLHPPTPSELWRESKKSWSARAFEPLPGLLRPPDFGLLPRHSRERFEPVFLCGWGLIFLSLLGAWFWWRQRKHHTEFFDRQEKSETVVGKPVEDECARKLRWLRIGNRIGLFLGAVVFVTLAWWLGNDIWKDTFVRSAGEPFSLTTGISAWPAVTLRVLAAFLAVVFSVTLYAQLLRMFYDLTCEYRFPLFRTQTRGARVKAVVKALLRLAGQFIPRSWFRWAQEEDVATERSVAYLWASYRERGHWARRVLRALPACLLYYWLSRVIYQLFGDPFQLGRGAAFVSWSTPEWRFFITFFFLLLTFLTIDAALLCRWFIERLTVRAFSHHEATQAHFRAGLKDVDDDVLDAWIDVQLIARLTERVGRLLWLPAIVFLLLLLARNGWWDRSPWHAAHVIIMTLNFLIALASVVILQRAAKNAKATVERKVSERVTSLKALSTKVSPEEKQSDQSEKLLEKIRNFHEGAFASSIWQNPVLGALMVGPGGLTLLQLIIWFIGR